MKNAFEYEAELAALREELASAKQLASGWKEQERLRGIQALNAGGALTAAEQRNADMLNWLRRQANAEKDPTVRATFIEAHNALKQIAKEVVQ